MSILLSLEQLLLFIPAALILAITPGPAVTYIVARSIDQGRRAGLTSAFAIASGNLTHVVGAVLGLSALLASSALAFDVIKYLGAAYLIYLGVRTLLGAKHGESTETIERKSLWRVYRDGVVVGMLNPKTALFFLSFLPQFVDNTRDVSGQLLFLGLLFVIIAGLTDSLYAFASGTAVRFVRGNVRFKQMQRYVTGTIYIGLGLSVALTGSRKST